MQNQLAYFCPVIYVDTHTHLYLDAFDADRKDVVYRAIKAGVTYLLLPNIDSSSVESMKQLCGEFPAQCFPMMGLHPTSVNESWKEELALVEKDLMNENYIAVGEIGLDFYWDKTFIAEQETVFRKQIELSASFGLPMVIHSRKSIDRILNILKEYNLSKLKGVFHCFPGSYEQAKQVISMGFYLGIGGVVTFKNSTLGSIVRSVGLNYLLLETDAPFITPEPYRGKRNESAYIPLVASAIAHHCNTSVDMVAEITTQNAFKLFDRLSKPTDHENLRG